MFRDEVLRSGASVSGHIDRKQLSRRLTQHETGVADHGYTLWAVWVLERWLQQVRVPA
jgi:hypothetical protein